MSSISTAAFDQDGTRATLGPSPSQAQIALALILLRSKPLGLSLEEYFDQLRKHIRSGSQGACATDHEHLDSIAFWKQAYEESEAAQAELLDKIYELEHHQNAQDSRAMIFDIPEKPANGRLKRGNEAVAKANSQSKRRAVPAQTSQPLQTNIGEVVGTTNVQIIEGRH